MADLSAWGVEEWRLRMRNEHFPFRYYLEIIKEIKDLGDRAFCHLVTSSPSDARTPLAHSSWSPDLLERLNMVHILLQLLSPTPVWFHLHWEPFSSQPNISFVRVQRLSAQNFPCIYQVTVPLSFCLVLYLCVLGYILCHTHKETEVMKDYMQEVLRHSFKQNFQGSSLWRREMDGYICLCIKVTVKYCKPCHCCQL